MLPAPVSPSPSPYPPRNNAQDPGEDPALTAPSQQPPKPCSPVTIEVHDCTTHDSDPHGRTFTITITPETAAGDIMYSLAPPRSRCVVLICWGDGRRCLLDPRDDMLEVARRCWLEVVDAQ